MLELGFDMPSMVIDINVFRTASRIFGEKWSDNLNFSDNKQIEQVKSRIEHCLPNDYLIFQIVHTMLLLQGKHICKAKTKCEKCIITEHCSCYINNFDKKDNMKVENILR